MTMHAADTPPMGWNSWDVYGASVTEDEVERNARYLAENLLKSGWEYVVVDGGWYEPAATSSKMRPFAQLELDDWGRLLPAVNRFPSAVGGAGFKVLADRIHDLGLKFGIHAMRGIPRQAVHLNLPINGTSVRASEIAAIDSICSWNTDMYGVLPASVGAQRYYDSLFELYGSWGVDYVKFDDVLNPYSQGEIDLIRNAAELCSREIVVSLSPGPTALERADHLKLKPTLWRISDDFWDRWEDLYQAFETCARWAPYSGSGRWPDADMLPIGHVAVRSLERGIGDRWSRFSKDEQVCLMTLWCMARSPLMLGAELSDLDDWTASLLTNAEVFRVLKQSHNPRQLYRYGDHIAWTSQHDHGDTYLAVFNTGVVPAAIETNLASMGLNGPCEVRDLWQKCDLDPVERLVAVVVPSHGARMLRLRLASQSLSRGQARG